MTKTHVLRVWGGGDHIADLHLLASDDNAIHEQLNQLPFLLKRGLGQALLDPLAKGIDGLDHSCQFVVPSDTGFQLAHLTSYGLEPLLQFQAAAPVLLQLHHIGQIGVGEPLHLLFQTHARFAEILPPSLQFLGQPVSTLRPLQGCCNGVGMGKHFTDILPHQIIKLPTNCATR
jgi:hypothetical protein